jgi:hypothetical protein
MSVVSGATVSLVIELLPMNLASRWTGGLSQRGKG